MDKFIFICGPHAAGKTSIIKALKDSDKNISCYEEIGKELFYSRKFCTDKQGIEFEKEVSELEVKRDILLVHNKEIKIVETWHPGNLAYASVRNPNEINDVYEIIDKSPYLSKAIGIWLRIPKEVIIKRTKTFKDNAQWAGNFYSDIDKNIEKQLKFLGLYDKTNIVDANRDFNLVLADIKKIIYNK